MVCPVPFLRSIHTPPPVLSPWCSHTNLYSCDPPSSYVCPVDHNSTDGQTWVPDSTRANRDLFLFSAWWEGDFITGRKQRREGKEEKQITEKLESKRRKEWETTGAQLQAYGPWVLPIPETQTPFIGALGSRYCHCILTVKSLFCLSYLLLIKVPWYEI